MEMDSGPTAVVKIGVETSGVAKLEKSSETPLVAPSTPTSATSATSTSTTTTSTTTNTPIRRRIQRKRLSSSSKVPLSSSTSESIVLPPPPASDGVSSTSISSSSSSNDSISDSDSSTSIPSASLISSPGAPFSLSASTTSSFIEQQLHHSQQQQQQTVQQTGHSSSSLLSVKVYSFSTSSSTISTLPVWTTPTAFLCVAADPTYTDLVDLLASNFALFGAWNSTLVAAPNRKQLAVLLRRVAGALAELESLPPTSNSSRSRSSDDDCDDGKRRIVDDVENKENDGGGGNGPASYSSSSSSVMIPVPSPPEDGSESDSWAHASITPPDHATLPAIDQPPPPPPISSSIPDLTSRRDEGNLNANEARDDDDDDDDDDTFASSDSQASSEPASPTTSDGTESVNTNIATLGSGTSRANRSGGGASTPFSVTPDELINEDDDAPRFGKEFVLYWAGHSLKMQDTLGLQLVDGDLFWPVDFMAGLITVLRTQGYTKLLMILDVCYSEYITSSLDLLAKMHTQGSALEVVIVGSSQGHERTIDGSTDLSTYILKNISRLSPAASSSSVSGGQGPSGVPPPPTSAVEQLAWLCYRAELLPKNALTVPRIIEGHSWYTRFVADVQRMEWSDQPTSLLVASRALFVDESAGSSSTDHQALSTAVLDRLTNPHTAWKLFPITGPPNCGKSSWVASLASPSGSADPHTRSLAAALVAWCPYDARSQHASQDLVEVIVWSLGTTFREYDGVDSARVSTLAKLVQNRTEGRFDIHQWCALLATFLRTLPESPTDHPVYSVATRSIGAPLLSSHILIIDGLLRPSDTRGDVADVLSVVLTAKLPWLRVIAPFLPAYRAAEAFQEVASLAWQDAPRDRSGGTVGRIAPVVDVVEDAGWNVRERVAVMDSKLASSDSVFDGFATRLFGMDPQNWELASPLLGVMVAATDTLSLPSITVIVERLRDYPCRHVGNRSCRCRVGRVDEMLELLAPLLSISWDEDRKVTLIFPKFGKMAARIGYRASATVREPLQDVVDQAHEALAQHFLDAWKDWVTAGADPGTRPDYSLEHLVGHILVSDPVTQHGLDVSVSSTSDEPKRGSALWRLTRDFELIGDWTWFKTSYASEEGRAKLIPALKAARLFVVVDLVSLEPLSQRDLLQKLVGLMCGDSVSQEALSWWTVFWASVWGSQTRYESVVPLVSVLMATARIPTQALVSTAVKQWRRSPLAATGLDDMICTLCKVLELGPCGEQETPDELMARLHAAVKDWVPERIAYKQLVMDVEWGHESLARACLNSWAARDVVSSDDDDSEDASTETDSSSIDYAVCHVVYHAVNGAGNEPHAALWRMKLAGRYECVSEWDWFHLMLVSTSGHGGMPALLSALRSLGLDDVAETCEAEVEPWNMLDRLLLEKCRGSHGAYGEAFEANELQAWARPTMESAGSQTRTGVTPLVPPEKEVVVTRRGPRGASRRVTVGAGGSLNFWLVDGSKRAGGSLPLGNGAVYGCWRGRVVVEPEIAHLAAVGGVHAILATVDVNGVLSIWWDVTSSPRRRLKYRTTLGGRFVSSLCVFASPEGDHSLVLCGCASGEVVVFDPVRGRELYSLIHPDPGAGAVKGVLCVQGSTYVAVGYDSVDMTVWPLPQRTPGLRRRLLCGTSWVVPPTPNPSTSVNHTPGFVPWVDLGGGLMLSLGTNAGRNALWVYRWDEGHYHQVGRPVLLDEGVVTSMATVPDHLDTVEVRYQGNRTCGYKLSL